MRLGLAPEDDDDAQATDSKGGKRREAEPSLGGRGDTGPEGEIQRGPHDSGANRTAGNPQAERGAAPFSEPQHAPVTPDDPALVQESKTLFPDPENERLIASWKEFACGL